MALMEAINQEYTDELLVTTTLLKEALKRDNLRQDEVSNYIKNRGLYIDRDGNIKQENNRDNHELKDDKSK